MNRIEIYVNRRCGYSQLALNLLDAKGLDYEQFDTTDDVPRELEMRERSGRHTVPQIFIGGKPIGGFDELDAFERRGELDALVQGLQEKSCTAAA